MYRVFEALDELGAIVEEARGVPMTAGCMVPRGDVLELIDDIKDAIPGELDDAQDVLDARDSLLREAKEHAESIVSQRPPPRPTRWSTTPGRRPTGCWPTPRRRPTAWSPRRASTANAWSARPATRPTGSAATAKREYEASTGRAKSEADRLIENGNLSYEKAVQEGIKEQQRLVSQTEIVADRDRRGDPPDRLRPRRGRPAARRVRHLRRQQARRVRGLPQRHAALGRPRTSPAAHRGGHARLRGPVGRRRATVRYVHGDARQGGGAPRSTVAPRNRHLAARQAAGLDDHRPGDGAHSGADRHRADRHARRAPRCISTCALESVSEGVLVTGTVSAPTTGECARCLTPVTGDVEIDLTELFAYPDSATEATTEDDEIPRVGRDRGTRPSISSSRSSTPSGWRCRSRRCARPDCPGIVPGVRSPAGRRRTRSSPRGDRPAVGQAGAAREQDAEPGGQSVDLRSRRWRRRDGRPRAAARGARRRPARRAADHRAHPPQLRLRERRRCPPTSGWSSSATPCWA